MFFRMVRLVAAPVLLLTERLITPKGVVRSAPNQRWVDEQTRHLALYQFRTCTFCVKTRRTVKRLSLNIQLCDAQHDPQSRQELLEGGGQVKVPCLKIVKENGDTEWMYESDDIIAYLQGRFGET